MTLNLLPSPEKNLHSDLCLYIFEGLFLKKEKEKKNIIARFLRLKKTKAFSKLWSFQEGTRISNEDFWKYFCKPSG